MTTNSVGAMALERCGELLRRSGLGWLVAFAVTPGRALQLVRYTGASAAALALDTALFLTLVDLAVVPAPVAGAIGYLVGGCLHYALSVRFIFSAAKTGKTHRRLIAEFLGTGLVGLLLTVCIIWLATDVAGLPPFIAKAISICVSFISVYLARAAGVFAERPVGDDGLVS